MDPRAQAYERVAEALKLERPLDEQRELWANMIIASLDRSWPGTTQENLMHLLGRAEEACKYDSVARNAWRFVRLAEAAPTTEFVGLIAEVAWSCDAFNPEIDRALNVAMTRLTVDAG